MENEELELDLGNDSQEQAKLKDKNRFDKLSEKVILTAKERDEAQAKVKAEADARLQAEKERDFFKDFSKTSSQFPSATEYQDKIWEKVKGGYTVEDATVAVLNKEGKLPGQTPVAAPPSPAGGSAATTVADLGDKPLEEMSKEEKYSALEELTKKGINPFQKN